MSVLEDQQLLSTLSVFHCSVSLSLSQGHVDSMSLTLFLGRSALSGSCRVVFFSAAWICQGGLSLVAHENILDILKGNSWMQICVNKFDLSA